MAKPIMIAAQVITISAARAYLSLGSKQSSFLIKALFLSITAKDEHKDKLKKATI